MTDPPSPVREILLNEMITLNNLAAFIKYKWNIVFV